MCYHVIIYTDCGREIYDVASISFKKHSIELKTTDNLNEPDVLIAKRMVNKVEVTKKEGK